MTSKSLEMMSTLADQERSSHSFRGGWSLAIIATVLVAFGHAYRFELLNWDDIELIVRNPYVSNGSFKTLLDAWKQQHDGLYIPVVYNLWFLIAQIPHKIFSSLNPSDARLFHASNVLVHCLNAVLVFHLIRRTLAVPNLVAFAGAVVFAIHPLQMEAVCWATGMKDLFSSCLALLAIHCYLSATDYWKVTFSADRVASELTARPKGHMAYSASLILFFLASLAKPGVVAVPLIMGTCDVILRKASFWKAALRLLPFGLIGIGAIVWTSIVQPVYFATLPLGLRPALAAHSLAFYLWKVFVPSGFALDYGLTPWRVLVSGQLLWAWIAPFVIFSTVALLRYPVRRQMIGASLVFIAGVLPVLGLVPFLFQHYSTVADRYAYLSVLGVGLAVAVLFQLASSRERILIWIVLLSLTGLTLWQSQVWRTHVDLYRHVLQVNPNSGVAYNNMAVCLFPVLGEKGLTLKASTQGPTLREAGVDHIDWLLARAIATSPDDPLPLCSQLVVWYSAGRTPEALKQAEYLSRRYPYLIEEKRMYLALGEGYASMGQEKLAREYLIGHLVLFPCDMEAISVLSIIHDNCTPTTAPATHLTAP